MHPPELEVNHLHDISGHAHEPTDDGFSTCARCDIFLGNGEMRKERIGSAAPLQHQRARRRNVYPVASVALASAEGRRARSSSRTCGLVSPGSSSIPSGSRPRSMLPRMWTDALPPLFFRRQTPGWQTPDWQSPDRAACVARCHRQRLALTRRGCLLKVLPRRCAGDGAWASRRSIVCYPTKG